MKHWPIALLLAAPLAATAAATGPAARPQLGADAAAQHTAAAYLAQGPQPWQPLAPDVRRWRPDFVVAADRSGTHRTVQAAVDAVPAAGAADGAAGRRWFIQVKPGVYRGPLCVQGKAPLAIYGSPGQAGAATLVDRRFNGLPKRPGIDAAQPCHPNLDSATHGTSGSATVAIASDDVLLAHLTIANDASEAHAPAEGAQAVALMTAADRIQLEDLRLVSHQDTFYVKRPAPAAAARVFVRGSLIEGDVDFVFGNATLVIDDSTLLSRAGRLGPGRGGHVLAPSTPASARFGFLVQRSRFVAEPGVPQASTSLGRAWDEGVRPGGWQARHSPNGQALVRDSALGPHLALDASPWAASTARRPFDPQLNRLAEFGNRRLPVEIGREPLAADGGWAAADGGTRGGADAAPADVHEVSSRAELAAALRAHERPRIVKLRGRIDLSVDDAGQAMGAEHYRDPAFDWPAFFAAYDPATWGRRPPAGPLEEARRRSAQRQAARVLLQLPSRTTLVGIGPGAAIVNGGLVLEQVSDVIVRNLHFSDAYDHFPAWDPQDGRHGEWNSAYDNLALRGATRVWIDHCTFDDGERPDAAEPLHFGRRMQRHDGLLDITRGADLVTVSWNHFRAHDKTVLVGGSDRHAEDAGRLRVSFHHNLWEQTAERSPRVRHGQVELRNNLYLVHEIEGYGYSIGVGHRSAILSRHNAWETPPGLPAQRLLRALGGEVFADQGSTLNGEPVDLLAALRAAHPGATFSAEIGWQAPAGPAPDPAAEAGARVRAGAGAGRLWTAPGPRPGRPPP
jgi:pectin methylesterase-like acyl-CoA thioesterase/pectate lyase